MAARRLIAILLVLLFLSSLAAALAPVQEGRKVVSSSTSTTTTADVPTVPAPDAAPESRLVKQSVDASAEPPAVVRARVGDQLQLRVTSQRSGTVELHGLGPTEDVGARQPAHFDVLLRDDGSYPVRFLGTEQTIAEIRVDPLPGPPAVR